MRRFTTALVATLVVLSTVGAVPAAGVQMDSSANADVTAQEDDGTDDNETADEEADGNASEVAPGERLAGAIGVQEAELDGELEARSFGLSVARAASDEARAALVAAEVKETGRDLERLRERREQLREARANGSMSEGEYRARVAELGARSKTVERMANESESASRGLPEEILRENGVNVTAIRTLRDEARNLSGGEVAEIARSIAGNSPGRPEQARDSDDEVGDRSGRPTEVPTDDDVQAGGDAAANSTAGASTGQDAGSDAADGSDGSDAGTSGNSGGSANAGGGNP